MSKVKKTVWLFHCERCEYEWLPRQADTEPKNCPHCKSPYWNKPRQKGKAKGASQGRS